MLHKGAKNEANNRPSSAACATRIRLGGRGFVIEKIKVTPVSVRHYVGRYDLTACGCRDYECLLHQKGKLLV